MKLEILDTKGKVQGNITLNNNIFGGPLKSALLAQAVRVYLSNKRQSPAKTKTRMEVNISTRKIYKQKGTGRARHGAKSAPIFVGGGVAHGPTGEQNYKLKLNKKLKKLALKNALADKLQQKQIIVVKGIEEIKPKTQALDKVINNLKVKEKLKISLVLPGKMANVYQAARNLPYLQILQARELNALDILKSRLLIFSDKSFPVLEEKFKTK